MKQDIFPTWRGEMEYVCLGCGKTWPADQLVYACPSCNGVLLLRDKMCPFLKLVTGEEWRLVLDGRMGTRINALRGIFRFYEFLAPIVDQEDIVWLGEAHTPIVEAAPQLRNVVGASFAYKNDGQNPSASFKDRGMACAVSYLKWLCRKKNLDEVLCVCASTGDTSAAAALYTSYVGKPLRCVVLLPRGKVTPQQLAQPLGSGAQVLELPGVFDDCMRVVEILAAKWPVALLNSKNSWRILGQESYAMEAAQWYNWDVSDQFFFVPIGNAGNITAIMSGFLKLYELGIIKKLPRIFGVQSSHADPVFRYYDKPENERVWQPVTVRPSVAQAAMIGNPVSFPRVRMLAEKFIDTAGPAAFQVIRVEEQEIIEAMILANRHGNIACTQGGECLAGLMRAVKLGLIDENSHAVLDSTAHSLKFVDFQNMYFNDSFPPDYEVRPNPDLANKPVELLSPDAANGIDPAQFAELGARAVAEKLGLNKEVKK